MKKNVLIIGAGGVAHVAAHLAVRHADELGRLVIASRRVEKADAIARDLAARAAPGRPAPAVETRALDAMDVAAVARAIRETDSGLVLNLATAYVNMTVLEACLRTGAAYFDTAVHEDPALVCEAPPWYANHEWKRRDRCREEGVTAILGVGFDPGVVNAYAAYAARRLLDRVDELDILDVNAGSHGRYYATNFDPEINLREFHTVWSWEDGRWLEREVHAVRQDFDFPEVGRHTVYLTGHDEVHSLAAHLDVPTIRFWMGFSEHSVQIITMLRRLGLTSVHPVRTAEGVEVVPLKVLKAVLPDPMSLAPGYTGRTCIGVQARGVRDGRPREVLVYNVCDHAACYREVGQHAIFYTAGVPPVAAARLVASGVWDVRRMANVEELEPEPFLRLLSGMGLPTRLREGGATRALRFPGAAHGRRRTPERRAAALAAR